MCVRVCEFVGLLFGACAMLCKRVTLHMVLQLCVLVSFCCYLQISRHDHSFFRRSVSV